MLPDDSILQNRYHILRQLGRGGMGAVYLARDRKFGSHVAVKEMLIPDNPDCHEAFVREATLLNSMRHPALSHVIDYFAECDKQFLVMQYIEGRSLDDSLSEQLKAGQKPFGPEQVIDWVGQILDALDYLHSHKPSVLHQDIKPQNLILTPQGKVMLLDFGLARIQVAETGKYASLMGYTPPYASWEQLNGEGIDPRSDLFSLAATAYHLLAGELPPDAQRRMFQVVGGQADPLRMVNTLNPRVPLRFAEILHGALALDKANRPSSAAEMLSRLNQVREAAVSLNNGPINHAQAETVGEHKTEAPSGKPAPYQEGEDYRESLSQILMDSVAGAQLATRRANFWISKSSTETDVEKSKTFMRLSHEAAKTARDLMIAAERARRILSMSRLPESED